MMTKPVLLFVTDLYYEANQRTYHTEDLFLTAQLRTDFHLAICHPTDTEAFEHTVDAIVIRNSGPVIYYKPEYEVFKQRLAHSSTVVYNDLQGKADMQGKYYLVDLTTAGFPVVPTVDCPDNLARLPNVDHYVLKPIDGADSIGMMEVSAQDLEQIDWQNHILQPRLDIHYEVSFYFIDDSFQYALYAPHQGRRWQLEPYPYSEADLAFARKFIDWNNLSHGIQRVDACRTESGELLLMELEDLNPFLSLLDLEQSTVSQFVETFKQSLWRALNHTGGV